MLSLQFAFIQPGFDLATSTATRQLEGNPHIVDRQGMLQERATDAIMLPVPAYGLPVETQVGSDQVRPPVIQAVDRSTAPELNWGKDPVQEPVLVQSYQPVLRAPATGEKQGLKLVLAQKSVEVYSLHHLSVSGGQLHGRRVGHPFVSG